MSELQRQGVLAIVICSEPFRQLGKAQARVFGAPDLPLVFIPHPLGGLTPADVHARADIALPQLVSLIRERSR